MFYIPVCYSSIFTNNSELLFLFRVQIFPCIICFEFAAPPDNPGLGIEGIVMLQGIVCLNKRLTLIFLNVFIYLG